jgi:hypothetical protein
MVEEDPLLRYCVALDAGSFDQLGEVLALAKTDPGLEAAIAGIHQRFDSNESFTEQLRRQRDMYSPQEPALVHCPYCHGMHPADQIERCPLKPK